MSISTQVPIEKCEKSGHVNGEDRISNLPESLISHILSCLATKDAVRTCVLSKYWEFKWTSSYNLAIDDTGINLETFPSCIERILLLSPYVRSFRLHCQKDYPLSRIAQWISAVLRRNVESLEVNYPIKRNFESLEVNYRTKQGILLLPRSLLDSTSLRILKLELPCTFKVPSKNCFPNLSSLHLEGVEVRNELSNSDTLIFTFPVLETMKLIGCIWLNVKYVEIHAPQLKNFKIQTPCSSYPYGYSIKIVADKLVHFESWGGVPENLILTESSVSCVTLNHLKKTWDPRFAHGLQLLLSLLEEFQSLEDLELYGWIWELALSKRGLALPRYDKLRRLTLLGSCIEIKSLLELLHGTPSLKALVVNMYYTCVWPDDYDYEGVESLPSCIANHLEEVELIYSGKVLVSEYLFEKFLLKNGLGLKTLHLRGGYHKKEDTVMLLSAFPKGSTCLTIVVT